MENEMMNNMDTMTENLTDAMPEVDNLVPSVDENHAEMSLARRQYSCWLVPQLTRALSCSASTYSFRCATRQRTGLTARRRRTSPSKQK